MLLNYQDSGLLDSTARKSLCNLIISRELQKNPDTKITTSRLFQLAYDITQVFKKESSSVYFTPFVSFSPGQKTAAKGKLLDCYRQRRRWFAKTGLINTRKRSRSSSRSSTPSRIGEAVTQFDDPSEDSAEIEEKLLWLQNSVDPWQTVEAYWTSTAKERFKKLSDEKYTIAQYFNEYKALGQQGGLYLVCSYILFLCILCTRFLISYNHIIYHITYYMILEIL